MSGEIEVSICSFCRRERPVLRSYIRPSKHVPPTDIKERAKLYNEGNYSVILWYCDECGEPKLK